MSDLIDRQTAQRLFGTALTYKERNGKLLWTTAEIKQWIADFVEDLPSAQPEQRCVNCGRTVNNGGWYEDGRTRCPIEEHYALPKDGYCHLWEKAKVWEDNYAKRPEESEK